MLTAAIVWTPTIRGILILVIAVVVLVGSVYLLLATNSGPRTGMLIALTGLFGWMFLMGIIWTMYGIGWAGRAPSWQVQEINVGDLSQAELAEARNLEDWTELPPENRKRGDAQAVAELYLTTGDGAQFSAPGDFVVLTAYDLGGKPQGDPDAQCKIRPIDPELDGCWERITNKIRTATIVRHPTHYAIVQVQPVVAQEALPGEPPPRPVADESRPVYSVIMVRDLGNRRGQPLLFTVLCGVLFAIFANMLHRRDKVEAAARAAFLGAKG